MLHPGTMIMGCFTMWLGVVGVRSSGRQWPYPRQRPRRGSGGHWVLCGVHDEGYTHGEASRSLQLSSNNARQGDGGTVLDNTKIPGDQENHEQGRCGRVRTARFSPFERYSQLGQVNGAGALLGSLSS